MTIKGKIKKLVQDKGFGFIKGSDNEEYFFHKSSVKNGRMEDLVIGQEVEFDPEDSEKGPRAEDIYI